MVQTGNRFSMKNGTAYAIHVCINEQLNVTPERLKQEIREAWKGLSDQSRWQRFASAMPELSDRQLDYLTDIDGHDRVAWCAALIERDDLRGIGVARYFRISETPQLAEFAVTVLDAFQGQGVGRQLMLHLIDSARANAIHTLRGHVLHSNKAMLALGRHLGGQALPIEGEIQLDIPVLPDA
jgi:GNAT superfamily N-acetyltransferase